MPKHIKQLKSGFREGRAAKAAKLHSLRRKERLKKAELKEVKAFSHIGGVSGGDYWSEKGELGRWVRVHVAPRQTNFVPMEARNGPRRKTRLMAERQSVGTYVDGTRFRQDDDWTSSGSRGLKSSRQWTGKTIFLVDKKHSSDFGTDQRRQRSEVINRNVSWADMEESSDAS